MYSVMTPFGSLGAAHFTTRWLEPRSEITNEPTAPAAEIQSKNLLLFPPIGDAAYRQHAGGVPNHEHRQHAQKLVKIARVVPEISSWTDRHRQTYSSFATLLTIGRIVYRREGGDGSAQRRRSVIYDCLVITRRRS